MPIFEESLHLDDVCVFGADELMNEPTILCQTEHDSFRESYPFLLLWLRFLLWLHLFLCFYFFEFSLLDMFHVKSPSLVLKLPSLALVPERALLAMESLARELLLALNASGNCRQRR